jgi:hypothetical protein
MNVAETDEPHASALSGALFRSQSPKRPCEGRCLTAALLLSLTLALPARSDVTVVPTVSLVVKDDPAPPIEPKKRYFKFRSGTQQEPIVHITPPPVGSADEPTIAGYHFHDATAADGPVFRVFVKPDKLFMRGGRTN